MRRPRVLPWFLLAALAGCAQCPDPFAPPDSPTNTLAFPTGIALHPTEPVLVVASSNFDSAFSSGAVLAARIDWLLAQLSLQDRIDDPVEMPWQAAALVPSLGATLAFTHDGAHLFHPTRQSSQLVQMDVHINADGLRLTCSDPEETVGSCTTGDHLLQVPTVDPFGLALRQEGANWKAYVGMLKSGNVHAVDFRPGQSGPARLTLAWSRDFGGNVRGGNMAILPSRSGAAEYLFASGRDLEDSSLVHGTVHMLNVWRAPDTDLLEADLFRQVGSLEVRGIAFTRDATRAYMINRTPAAVVELDVTRHPDGVPRMTVMRVAPLGKEPSHIALYEPPAGHPIVLATSFRDGLVVGVDTVSMDVVGVVRNVGAGPFDVAVDHAHGFAFVSCFNEDTVAVLALPRTPGENRFHLAARLGSPRSTTSTNPDLDRFIPNVPVPGP